MAGSRSSLSFWMLKRLSLADHAHCIQKPASSASPTAFIKAFQHFEVKESAVAMFFTTTKMVRDSRNASLSSLKVKVHKQRDKCSNLCWSISAWSSNMLRRFLFTYCYVCLFNQVSSLEPHCIHTDLITPPSSRLIILMPCEQNQKPITLLL